jgi:hypothetical protein
MQENLAWICLLEYHICLHWHMVRGEHNAWETCVHGQFCFRWSFKDTKNLEITLTAEDVIQTASVTGRYWGEGWLFLLKVEEKIIFY